MRAGLGRQGDPLPLAQVVTNELGNCTYESVLEEEEALLHWEGRETSGLVYDEMPNMRNVRWDTERDYLFSQGMDLESVCDFDVLMKSPLKHLLNTEEYFTSEELWILSRTKMPKAQDTTYGDKRRWKTMIKHEKKKQSKRIPTAMALTGPRAVPQNGDELALSLERPDVHFAMKDYIHDGVMSCHRDLNTLDRIEMFFQAHNQVPTLTMHISGVAPLLPEDKTSFKLSIDLTKYIFPYGKISPGYEAQIKEYLEDTNKLKAIQMMKYVHFDHIAICRLVRAYVIHCIGYTYPFDVEIVKSNASVRIYKDNMASSFWENPGGRLLTSLSIVGGIAMTAYGRGHRGRKTVRSNFAIHYTPLEIFRAIRDELPFSGPSTAVLARPETPLQYM